MTNSRSVSLLACARSEMVFASPMGEYVEFAHVAMPFVRAFNPARQPPEELGQLIESLWEKCVTVGIPLDQYDTQEIDPESRRVREEFKLGNGLDLLPPYSRFSSARVDDEGDHWDVVRNVRKRGQVFVEDDTRAVQKSKGPAALGAAALSALGIE